MNISNMYELNCKREGDHFEDVNIDGTEYYASI